MNTVDVKASAIRQRSASKAPHARPGSNPHTLAKLDRRTREHRLMDRVRKDLRSQLGREPTPVEAALIERAAVLTLYCALLDREAIEKGTFTIHGRNYLLAYSNSLVRTLAQLGIKASASKGPSLAEMLAHEAAE